jgi:cation diffusion facilitator family transporter
MDQCCAVREVPRRQRRVLWAVLAVNAAMFLLEFGAGLLARSTALLADSVDMLGDALVYGFSLHVVARGPIWQARAAILKGVIMAGFGAGVLIEVVVKLTRGSVPIAEIMAPIGAVALVANATCLWLLWRRRADDLNMRSAWLCSRNDVVANVGVLLAAAGVAVTGAVWPDILTGLAIAALFVGSAVGVLLEAGRALRPGVHAH